MNYKETFFFVAKCLTISLEAKNRQQIEKQLKSTSIDWDAVVKVSTSHYVFPALYCNLKRADFLQYLHHELVSYMEYITNINRERNEQIIQQAKKINNLLLANNITPIFLKGTGNLLSGIYDDIAERMVGDIDFYFFKRRLSKGD
ncbi:nucleotidyltransferase family protein [Polaribacter sp.]|nr:nucleotidyltransferase family protein [Polaribacter sp.]